MRLKTSMCLKKFCIAALMVVGMVASSYAANINTPESSQTLTDSSKSIQVAKNNPQFTIELASNPSTGFSWFLAKYNHHLVLPVKNEFIGSNSKALGAGGIERWTFQVRDAAFVARHVTSIKLLYIKPWNAKEIGAKKVFRVAIG